MLKNMLFIQVPILLWAINVTPLLLRHSIGTRYSKPIDRGKCFWDGQRIFGDNKTGRGIFAGIVVGGLFAKIIGFTFSIGVCAGYLDMLGDLITSFIKRRIHKPSGTTMPGFDQVFEGLLPVVMFKLLYSFSFIYLIITLFIFCFGNYYGAILVNKIVYSIKRTKKSPSEQNKL
jgi:uncharacterized protein